MDVAVDTWDTTSCVCAFADMETVLVETRVFNVETQFVEVLKFPCAKEVYTWFVEVPNEIMVEFILSVDPVIVL